MIESSLGRGNGAHPRPSASSDGSSSSLQFLFISRHELRGQSHFQFLLGHHLPFLQSWWSHTWNRTQQGTLLARMGRHAHYTSHELHSARHRGPKMPHSCQNACFKIINWKAEHDRERERPNLPSSGSLHKCLQCPLSQQPGAPPTAPKWAGRGQAHWPSSTALLGASAGRWMGLRAVLRPEESVTPCAPLQSEHCRLAQPAAPQFKVCRGISGASVVVQWVRLLLAVPVSMSQCWSTSDPASC